ncbi:adenylyl-sulfate kinase [Pseudomonas sp. NPDC090203]|uniref:adenylyl-sulfate kinase n=1 Tax=Pseudomonas sp. NPDC090203 TaxID=3364477 RepID=UPI00382B15E7
MRLGQRPLVVWFTGLSGAGKSTLAYALESALFKANKLAYTLDGDNVRHGLCRDLAFSARDRAENIRRVAEVARLMCEAGMITIVACISPLKRDREAAREVIGAHKFVEIYLSTPLVACEKQDPKGLYRKARAGLIKDFTGISAQYEAPEAPALNLDASESSVNECLEQILKLLAGRQSD